MFDIDADIDEFAISVERLVASSLEGAKENTRKVVAREARKGAKLVKGYASQGGVHEWSPEYVGGFHSHVETRGGLTTGEIGNSDKPGLVHLLEKGHATLNGRKTRAFPHMGPAFEDISADFPDEVAQAVGEGLMR